ncbi:MAG: hypothetical protein FWE48_04410 [Coriobacteriia bacterium]|nr:hypothetical protein [Coriobacteriia bacterium]MCL2870385.1 hypothetical protein [Coriobacteriia bacterium]
MSRVSKHGKKRIRQRTGLNKKSTEASFDKAKERGIHHGDMKGRLRKWVDSQIYGRKFFAYPIVYSNHLWLVDKKQDVLITVIPVPQNLTKDAAKMKVKRNCDCMQKNREFSMLTGGINIKPMWCEVCDPDRYAAIVERT